MNPVAVNLAAPKTEKNPEILGRWKKIIEKISVIRAVNGF